jgi:hypothetical protein
MNEIIAVLSPILGDELAKDIIQHRKGLKCPLTARGARALLKQYEATGNPVSAAEYHLNMGWRGFDIAWLKPKTNFRDEHNPSPMKTSANYGNTPPEPIPAVVPPEEMERRRQMVAKLRAEGVLRA